MIKRFLLGAGLMFLICSHVMAQGMVEPIRIPIKVRLSGGYADYENFTAPYATVTVGDSTLIAPGDPTDWTVQSPVDNAYLEVGRTYTLQVSSANGGSADTLKLVPPPGYTILMNGKAKTSLAIGADATVTVRVLAPSDSIAAPAGTATEFELGRVKWAVSLGTIKSGTSAGWLSIVGSGVASGTTDDWSSYINASSLYYEEDSSDLYVYRLKINGVQTIRQISMVEAFIDVTQVTDPTNGPTLVIGFYQPASVTGSYPKTFIGLPFVSYRISLTSIDSPAKKRKLTAIREFRDIASATDTTATVSRREVATLERVGTSEADYRWISTGWTLDGATPVARRVSQWSANATSGHDEVITVGDPVAGDTTIVANPVIQTRNTHDLLVNQLGGAYAQMLTGVTAGDVNDHPETASYAYHNDSTNRASYGFIKSQLSAGGNWSYYDYVPVTDAKKDDDKLGTIGKTYAPYLNAPATPGNNATAGVYTTYDYDTDAFKMLTRLKSSQTYVNNVLTAKTAITYTAQYPNGCTVVVASRQDQVNSSGTALASVSKYYREDTVDDLVRLQPWSAIKPDGSQQSYFYQRGTWNYTTKTYSSAGNTATCVGVFNGASAALPGATAWNAYKGQMIDKLWLVANRSTADFTIRDGTNLIIRTESYIWDGSVWQLASWVDFAYDYSNRLTSKASSNGDLYEAHYTNGLKDWERDGSGVKISYTYDAAGRVKTATKEGVGTQPNLVTTYTYDAANQVRQQDTAATGVSETLTTSKLYDLAGRVKSQTMPAADADGSYTTATTTTATTTYSYDPANRTNTVTLPNASTVIQTAYLDGQPYSKTGTGVVPEFYTYNIDPGSGQRTTLVNLGTANSPRYAKTTSDWLGRTVQTERPGFTGQLPFGEKSTYDTTTGLLTKTERGTVSSGVLTRLQAAILYEYDGLGQPTVSGMDIDGNDLLDRAGTDRISGQEKYFAYENSAWWLASRGYTYATTGSSTATTTGSSRQRISGFTGNLRAETSSTDAEGNTTTRTVTVDRAARTTTSTTVIPGLANPQVETAVNGLATTATTPDGLTVTNGYDSLQRLSTSVNPRTGTSTTCYYPGTTQIYNVKDARTVTVATYGYDPMGRTVWTRNADQKYTRADYNERGQPLHQWGDATYPASYHYSPTYGERDELKTYQGENNWNAPVWPAGSLNGTISTTTWAYDGPSGLLIKKTDDSGRYVEYDYTARGQVWHRYWARTLAGGQRVTATYSYDPQTAELLNTGYNDDTPAVATTYTRLGQPSTIADGTGTRTFGWDTNAPWRLNSETLPDFYQGRLLSRLYENSTDSGLGTVKGRASGFQLGTVANPAADLQQTIQCNALGRVAGLTSSRNGDNTQAFTYAYVPNSRLLQSIAATGTAFTLTRHYEDHRDLLDDIVGKWSTATRSHHAYVSNDLGQRQKSTQDGDAFADYNDSGEATHQEYLYDDRGELQSAHGYLGAGLDRPLPGRQYDFGYDAIGNRTSVNHTGQTGGAEAVQFNGLNQIASRQNKSLSVSGTASTDTSVIVENTQASRQGRFWQNDLLLDNSNGPVAKQIATVAAKPGAGTGGADLAQTDHRYVFLSRATETLKYDANGILVPGGVLTYDLDGNLTSDDHWDYEWDAENRLKAMTGHDWTGTLYGPSKQRLEFQYDYMGRRVQKRVLTAPPGSYAWSTLVSQTRYLYDGWNLVGEFALNPQLSTYSLVRSYTWGLDLVGSLSASGGVGALAQITEHATGQSYFPTYDGNGNVTTLTRVSDGGVVASYEYSPFGELLRTTGSYAKTNPFRFSTKFTDDETSLVYYGKRYYDPHNGRFINRDPIEERGGINLYGFCGNDGVNHTDYLGNSWFSKIFHKIGKWFKTNWKAVVGAVLMVIPGFQGLAIAWSTVMGYIDGGIRGMAIGYAAGALGAALGGPLGSRLAGAFNVTNRFALAGIQGALRGGFSGGAASVASGGKFGEGFISGAETGAVLSSGIEVGMYITGRSPQYQPYDESKSPGFFHEVGGSLKNSIDTIIGKDYGAAWRKIFTEKWVNGPTGGRLPESIAQGMSDVVQGPDMPQDAAANGMHAWHSGSNAYLAQQLGIIGAPLLLLGGIYHETPFDWASFKAEQHYQGSVNHLLDSTADIASNIFGMTVGYAAGDDSAVKLAIKAGNYIPGPGEPDPEFGGHGAYKGNPVDALGQYPKY